MHRTPRRARTVSKKNQPVGRKAVPAQGQNFACRNSFLIALRESANRLGLDRREALLRAQMECWIPCCARNIWPERDEVLRLCFALELEAAAAQRLLVNSCKRTLNPKLLRDAAILFSLEKRLTLGQAQALLRRLCAAPL